MEETGQTHTDFKQIIEQLDAQRPQVDVIDWTYFNAILQNHDFTKFKTTMDVMKQFYTLLWTHVLFPVQDELHLTQRENGRLIVETITWQKKAESLEQEVASLREQVPAPCNQGSEGQ